MINSVEARFSSTFYTMDGLQPSHLLMCGDHDIGGARKVGLRLLTNVPPAAGRGDITWQTQGLQSSEISVDGRFRGSPSILKSALQKNVRLCRAASAVRWGGILLTCTATHDVHNKLPQYLCAYEIRLVCDRKAHQARHSPRHIPHHSAPTTKS